MLLSIAMKHCLGQQQWRGGLSVTGGANTQTAAPPRTHTQTHLLPFCQNFLSRYRGGCRGEGGFHMDN